MGFAWNQRSCTERECEKPDLDMMFAYSSASESRVPSIHNPDALTIPTDAASSATIEEMANLWLTLNSSLEPRSFTTDATMDQVSSALAGPSFDTMAGTPEDNTMTVKFSTLARLTLRTTEHAPVN